MQTEKYKGYSIELDYDQFATNPTDDGNFEVVTFNRGGYAMDSKITDVDEADYLDEDGKLTPEMAEEVEAGNKSMVSFGDGETGAEAYVVGEISKSDFDFLTEYRQDERRYGRFMDEV